MRRVKVEVYLAGGVHRAELRSGDRLGPLEILRTEGNAWSVSTLQLAVAGNELSMAPAEGVEDLRVVEHVVAFVRAELDKRGWKVDGVSVLLEARP